jgi:hypothetical protein
MKKVLALSALVITQSLFAEFFKKAPSLFETAINSSSSGCFKIFLQFRKEQIEKLKAQNKIDVSATDQNTQHLYIILKNLNNEKLTKLQTDTRTHDIFAVVTGASLGLGSLAYLISFIAKDIMHPAETTNYLRYAGAAVMPICFGNGFKNFFQGWFHQSVVRNAIQEHQAINAAIEAELPKDILYQHRPWAQQNKQ